MTHLKTLLAAAAAAALATGAAAQVRGVTETEILIGGAHDLSGVFAAVSTPAVNGANMYIDMVNANGGVHGRTIRYIVEDHGYQLPRATQAFNKLIERDQVFAMLLNLGTPMNLAHYPLMERRRVPNISPLTAARAILPDPPGLNFAALSSYYDQMNAGIQYLHRETGKSRVCGMYLPTEFGEEVMAGARAGTEAIGGTWVAETTHRPDDQDFVGALTRLRSEGCEIIVGALGVRAQITAVGTAKRLGWDDAIFLVSSAGFLEAVAAVPGGATEGLYAAAGWVDIVSRAGTNPDVDAFLTGYQERYGQPAGGFAMLGYTAARQMVMALEAAGRDLTVESFVQGMYSIDYFDPLLDVQIKYGPGDHQGGNIVTISQVRDGMWHLLARENLD
jgi:branched-chain amino acid transport system substrate-binding protein